MSFEESAQKTQSHFQEEINSFRTSRANTGMISDIKVEAYGATHTLSQLSSIGVADIRTLLVEPWDKGIVKNIEKAIISSGRNISPAIDGSIIRVRIPEMTEENRRAMVKLLNEKTEQARVRIRRAREEEKRRIEQEEKSGLITKDDRSDEIKELDRRTREAIKIIEEQARNKEKEIMTI